MDIKVKHLYSDKEGKQVYVMATAISESTGKKIVLFHYVKGNVREHQYLLIETFVEKYSLILE